MMTHQESKVGVGDESPDRVTVPYFSKHILYHILFILLKRTLFTVNRVSYCSVKENLDFTI